MKVGILTFHNAYNNGAVLQTYASQEVVRLLGYNVVVIDYHNTAIDNNYKKKMFHLGEMIRKRPKAMIGYALEKILFWRQRKAYLLFIKQNLKLSSKRFNQSHKLISLMDYKLFMIGSDQLWNKSITGGFDGVYWGDFKTSEASIKVAWAICMNELGIDDKDKEFIKLHLSNFDYISVREDSLKSFLLPFTQKEIFHIMDPTLLLPLNCWEKLCRPVKKHNYIFVYAIKYESDTYALAKEIGAKLNKNVVYFHNNTILVKDREHILCGGPYEFLSYIKGADFVVTSSFHGTAFSLIFQKPFVCYEPPTEQNARVHSLLRTFNLENNIINGISQFSEQKASTYDVEAAIKPTMDFLHGVLKSANGIRN